MKSPAAAFTLVTCLVLLGARTYATLSAEPAVRSGKFPGEQSPWNGYQRYDFEIDGRKCLVVVPKTEAEGRPWIWRARFFGHEPQVDLALLERGFHLVYMDVAGLFGSPRAVGHWNASF